MKLLGAILAGGQSRRFGSDKAMVLFEGRPLIAHATASLRVWVDDIVICGRASPVEGAVSLVDRPRAGLGPLGGIGAALIHAVDHGFDAVFTVGCDTPIIPVSVFERLSASSGAAYVRSLPILARWPANLAGRLEHQLATHPSYRVTAFAGAVDAVAIDANVAIANLNCPEVLVRLQAS